MPKKFSVSVDYDANAAYVMMSDEPIVSTAQASDDVLVDLDELRMVVGIEFLRIDAVIPFQRLIDDFHVHSDDVERLRALRPSIAGHLNSAAEGTTSTSRTGTFAQQSTA